MQDADDDPMLEQLIQATQQLNRQINDAIQEDAINWGNVPTIQDLSESDCVSNCQMRKSSLQILSRIKCKNRYTIHYESGLIILLCRYSLPCLLFPDMEKSLEYENLSYLPLYNPFLKPFTKFLSHI